MGLVSVWDDCAKERNSLSLGKGENDDFVVVPEANLLLFTICDFELCFWLNKYVYEIKKKDGTFYPPLTPYTKEMELIIFRSAKVKTSVLHFPKSVLGGI